MSVLDPATLQQSFYARLFSDSAGATVRGLLGSGASSIIVRDDLDPANVPARPFLVFATGPIAGAPDYDMQRMQCAWWVYDDPIRKFSRIDALILPIANAYPADDPTVIQYCDVRRLSVSQPTYDSKLGGRPARSLPYQVSWR